MAEETKDGQNIMVKIKAYWLALGTFIHKFSELERQMQLLLWQESNVSPVTAKAIFSGVKIDQAKDLINRVRATKGLGEDARLSRIFSQITVISGARNDIVHYGAEFNEPNFTVSNKFIAHIPERIRKFSSEPDDLYKLLHDLNIISAGLQIYALELAKATPGAISAGNLDLFIAAIQPTADAPWLYKSPQQSQLPKPPRGKNPKRSPPQVASKE